MEKLIRGSRLVPETEFLDRRKTVIDNSVSNFEYFKHGNTEASIQVSNYKENLKGEKHLKIFMKIMFLTSKIM